MSEASQTLIDPYIGQTIHDRYRIERPLGQGGMGQVYLAQQEAPIRRQVALKVLHGQYAREQSFLARFRHEAEQLAALADHTRVVDIYDYGSLPDGGLFIVMEYVAGKTLREIIEEGALPWPRAIALGIQIAEGLWEAHQVNIVHRDLKPTNIMVRSAVTGEAVKLLDFGIAKSLSVDFTDLTVAGTVIGTRNYMAPETFPPTQRHSALSDLYAWGVVLYEMLTGNAPFRVFVSDTAPPKWEPERPERIRQFHPEVPAEVEQIVMQALEKEPQHRQQSMLEVITALRQVKGEEQPAQSQKDSGQRNGTTPIAEPSPRPRHLKLAGRVLGSLLAAGFVTLGVQKGLKHLPSESPGTETSVAPLPSEKSAEMTNSQNQKTEENTLRQKALDHESKEARDGLNQINGKTTIDEATARKVKDHIKTAQFYLERDQPDEAKEELAKAQRLDRENQEVRTMQQPLQKATKRAR